MGSQNVGEELVGAYLQAIEGCEFVSYNLHTPDTQGEIDVIALNRRTQTVYVCEVAVHLTTGLYYVLGGQPNNVGKLLDKFNKDIDYAEKYFSDHTRVFMLWCPIVRASKPGSKYDQMLDVEEVCARLKQHRDIDLKLIINDRFQDAIAALRSHARKVTKELKSPVLRLFQIEEKLTKHLS
jgi:hypothetical protein